MTKFLKRPISILLAVLMIAGIFTALPLTAYAAPTETLLTTITATGKEQASYSTANVATVSFSYLPDCGSAYLATWGWWGYGITITVAPVDGYTITKCVFYDDKDRTATDSEAPFVVETTEEDKTPQVNGTPILANTSKGIKKIEVYGYATPAHTHDFTYAADGATITATCNGAGTCDITSGTTLTISAPTGDLTADGTTTFSATLNDDYNTTAFPGTYTIVYTKDGQPYDGTPTEAGDYTASVTVGTATASVSYTVAAPGYTVTWKNWNGDVLETDENVAEGSTPTYDGEDPAKAADAQNTYTFAAWDDGTTTYVLGADDLPAVTADVTYTAVFTAETNTYKVTWKNWDGNVLKADENVPYGAVPEYKGARPEKPDVEDTAYTFTGWTPEVAAVTGDAEYTAEFGVHELIGDYYYVNGQRVGSYYGLIKYDGDFYYVDKYAKIIKNDEHWLVTTNGWTFADGTPIPKANYSFDADGKMIIPNGLVGDCYYIDGVKVGSYYGLVMDNGNYYYVDNNAKIVKNKTKFLNTTNGLTFADGTPIPKATYSFDADGKMIIPNGIDGDFYYINGVKVGSYYGLVKDGNDYYYVDANAKIVRSKNKYLTTTNGLTFPDGTPIPHKYFEFDADGKMIF